MISFANGHFHSLFSDGDHTPTQLVKFAVGIGHKALILTDHDTVRGTYELQKEARKHGILTLLGCEFTVAEGFHMCGFDFDPQNAKMRALLDRIAFMQTERIRLLFEWGQKRGTLTSEITWQDVLNDFPNNNFFCGNQVQSSLLKRGLCKENEMNALFKANFSWIIKYEDELMKLIHDSTVPLKPSAAEVVETLKGAGGVAVMAHPHNVREKKADELREMGVMGFETHHPDLNDEDRAFFEAYCDKYSLYKCGGTDHGAVMAGIFTSDTAPKATENCRIFINDNGPGPETGGMSEENFMKLYHRTLG